MTNATSDLSSGLNSDLSSDFVADGPLLDEMLFYAPAARSSVENATGHRGDRLVGAQGELFRALFDGLPPDDREWVIDRIRHYRRLAADDGELQRP